MVISFVRPQRVDSLKPALPSFVLFLARRDHLCSLRCVSVGNQTLFWVFSERLAKRLFRMSRGTAGIKPDLMLVPPYTLESVAVDIMG